MHVHIFTHAYIIFTDVRTSRTYVTHIMDTYIHINNMHAYIYKNTHPHTHSHMHAHTHTHTHSHMHTHIHTHR